MEASALPRSAALPRRRLAVPGRVLRLRSDDQLVALFRAGSDEAFGAIHDRYRVRLLAYARQMLAGSTADAEDALQEVFVRAHAGLMASSAPISLRAWLYRIAHNRCIDQLRRPSPIPSEIAPAARPALCRGPRHDPPVEAERTEEFQRLVADVQALPEQQRSALLMRELQGLSYEELGLALGISVAAVKSVLLRARGGILDAAEARAAPCAEIRLELVSAHDRGVRASGRARRHLRECDHCCAYRAELRAVRRQVAALAPVGPLGHLGLIFGLGGGGAGGGLAAGGSTAVLGGAAGATASKVAVLVCCAALMGSAGALTSPAHHRPAHPARAAVARHTRPAAASVAVPDRVAAGIAGGTIAPDLSPAASPAPAAAASAPRAASAPAPPPLTGQDAYGAGAGGQSPTLGLDAATGGNADAYTVGGTQAAPDATLTPAPAAAAPDASQTGPGPATAHSPATALSPGAALSPVAGPAPSDPPAASATSAPPAPTGLVVRRSTPVPTAPPAPAPPQTPAPSPS